MAIWHADTGRRCMLSDRSMIDAETQKMHLGLLADLRRLRAPLIALAVLGLFFQAAIPLAAVASPRLLSGISICLGTGDDGSGEPGKSSGHPALCMCGNVCPHAGFAKFGGNETIEFRAGDGRQYSGDVAPSNTCSIEQSEFFRPHTRAPPVIS